MGQFLSNICNHCSEQHCLWGLNPHTLGQSSEFEDRKQFLALRDRPRLRPMTMTMIKVMNIQICVNFTLISQTGQWSNWIWEIPNKLAKCRKMLLTTFTSTLESCGSKLSNDIFPQTNILQSYKPSDFHSTPLTGGAQVYKFKFCLFVCLYVITSTFPIWKEDDISDDNDNDKVTQRQIQRQR